MKLTVFFLITSFFIFISCNNENETIITTQTSNTIRFGEKIITSKALIEGTALPAGTQVGVFSWGHKSNEEINNTGLRKDLNNKPYTKSADSELTSDTHAHYPINPDTLLNFYAYYPYTVAATATPLSIPFELKKQDDIMWAEPVLNRGKSSAEETVNLSFNHLLSAITLKFKKADDIKEEMVLESIAMENYPANVQLNVQSGALSAAASTQPYTLIDSQSKEITPEEVTIVTDYLLYPIANPVFIVRMSGKDYRIESKKAFEKGKKQTYSFTIQAQDITISGSIKPWEDGGSSNETVYF